MALRRRVFEKFVDIGVALHSKLDALLVFINFPLPLLVTLHQISPRLHPGIGYFGLELGARDRLGLRKGFGGN